RKLDPGTAVLRCSWPPDTHVCGLYRMGTANAHPIFTQNIGTGLRAEESPFNFADIIFDFLSALNGIENRDLASPVGRCHKFSYSFSARQADKHPPEQIITPPIAGSVALNADRLAATV
ncbi:hypothetical protein, partial [Mesorhizobium sp. M0977]|uniref:hypothetical protein n=1 Tax=Mesorhizobium sp. M0977 TaxID=2957039 RepID=UPI0033359151